MEKIKVLWICEISNSKIRERLHLYNPATYWKNVIKRLIGRKGLLYYFDRGVWNTLAIAEYEQLDSIELHVVTPFVGMKRDFETFTLDGIYYYFIKIKHPFKLRNRFDVDYHSSFPHTRIKVQDIINRVRPDVINMIGAENPEYAVCAQDINTDRYPFMLSMQTALSDPDFPSMYPITESQYIERSKIEQEVFRKANYISTDASWYRKVASWYNPGATYTRYFLCSKQFSEIETDAIAKEYDFVYYALSIEKGAEDAIRSLYYACEEEPATTLNIIGRYSEPYFIYITGLIKELGLDKNVVFSGFFERQDDAIKQVMKSKAALVPIKVDIVSGTVREPMAIGLPVVTYITKGTPALNKDKETVLLANIGDYREMGANMVRLMRDKSLSVELVRNAKEYARDHWVSSEGVKFNLELYQAVKNHFYKGTQLEAKFLESIY